MRNVDVLEFEVERAWNLISCGGPPCCANSWLLDVGHGIAVAIESWGHLRARDGAFPGRRVKLEVWPLTKRLLTASHDGAPVSTRILEGATLGRLTARHGAEVRELRIAELPAKERAQIEGA